MASYRVTRRSALKCTIRTTKASNQELYSEQTDQQLDVETVDPLIDPLNVKQEIFNDDMDQAAMEFDSSPNSDGMEQRFSYELLDMSTSKQTNNNSSFRQSQSSDVIYGTKRSNRRGRPRGSRNHHGVVASYTSRNMSLEQIWRLNDKLLVNYFSEPSSNELTRNFAYTCALIPETCAETFTSFGSELKARNMMKEHLLNHMRLLVTRSRVEPGFTFSAQKVQARKKSIAALRGQGRRRKANERSPEKPSMMDGIGATDFMDSYGGGFDALTHTRLSDARNAEHSHSSPDASIVKQETLEDTDVSPSDRALMLSRMRRVRATSRLNLSENTDSLLEVDESISLFSDHPYSVTGPHKKSRADIPSDVLSRTLPDTRTSGRKYALADTEYDGIAEEPDDEQLMSVVIQMYTPRHIIASRLIIPMIRVPRSGLISGENGVEPPVIGYPPSYYNGNAAVDSSNVCDHPTVELATVQTDTQELDDLDKGSVVPQRICQVRRRTFQTSVCNKTDQERNLAIQLMRELKNRSKEQKDLVPYKCQICKSRTFTAIATLMYHYRSHAGIKPYICMICNTTFTRQHSLNYHMLIHNNQNRFTCKDCGRRFRHPSHFKEHLRRHTGETPFKCTDCPSRFKTRNTYKRHLRTRHGKLLVADGIIRMKQEDFLRVRTKPYLHQVDANEMAKDAIQDSFEAAAESLDGQLADFLEDNKDNIDIIDLPESFIVDQFD